MASTAPVPHTTPDDLGPTAVTEDGVQLEGPTVLVITGGNIDAERFASILSSE